MVVLFFLHGEDALPVLLVDPAGAARAGRREHAVHGVRGQGRVARQPGLETAAAVVIGRCAGVVVVRLARLLGRDAGTGELLGYHGHGGLARWTREGRRHVTRHFRGTERWAGERVKGGVPERGTDVPEC